jgi:hypothetical protein
VGRCSLHCYGLAFQAECYHYLLDAAVKMYQLGIDWTTPEHGPINSAKRLCTVISPDVPNGAHAAKSSKVISLLLVICEFNLLYSTISWATAVVISCFLHVFLFSQECYLV